VTQEEDTETARLGAPAWTGEHTVLTGSCSWTDKTLVEESDWYPQRTMSAEERLRFYASQFPLTEIDSTYYAVVRAASRQPDRDRSAPRAPARLPDKRRVPLT